MAAVVVVQLVWLVGPPRVHSIDWPGWIVPPHLLHRPWNFAVIVISGVLALVLWKLE